MRNGIHTIRSGISQAHNPSSARRYTLNNGDYRSNMQLIDCQIILSSNALAAGVQDKPDADTVFFVVATSEAGAIPTASTNNPAEYPGQFAHRLGDSRQIAWGTMTASGGINIETIVDPDHIIPDDVYVNAWSTSASGAISIIANPIGFMLKFKQKKQSGSEALLAQAKENALE